MPSLIGETPVMADRSHPTTRQILSTMRESTFKKKSASKEQRSS